MMWIVNLKLKKETGRKLQENGLHLMPKSGREHTARNVNPTVFHRCISVATAGGDLE
jgi:hypothetical protein